jgi:hypothetical protein
VTEGCLTHLGGCLTQGVRRVCLAHLAEQVPAAHTQRQSTHRGGAHLAEEVSQRRCVCVTQVCVCVCVCPCVSHTPRRKSPPPPSAPSPCRTAAHTHPPCSLSPCRTATRALPSRPAPSSPPSSHSLIVPTPTHAHARTRTHTHKHARATQRPETVYAPGPLAPMDPRPARPFVATASITPPPPPLRPPTGRR